MNWQLGLMRISVVWWSFWAILSVALGLAGLFGSSGSSRESLLMIGAILPIYLLHKVTCWIIAGFFASRH